MSGGHFKYKEFALGEILEQLEEDLQKHEFENPIIPKEILPRLIVDVMRVIRLLKAYDYAMSEDTSEKEFIKAWKK